MGRGIFIILILLLTLIPLGSQEIRVGCLNTNSIFAPLVTQVLEEAGFQVKMQILPPERSWAYITQGQIDLEFFRVKEAPDLHPDLLVVNVPLIKTDFYAYGKKPGLKIESWDDLKNYRIGYARGMKILQEKLKDLHPYEGMDNRKLAQMLTLGRIDIIVTNSVTAGVIQAEQPGLVLIPEGPPLISTHAITVLHRSREAWMPRLEQAFQRWIRDGRWQKGLSQALNRP